MGKRFVLIDRDGTLNVESSYLTHPDEVLLIPGAGKALKRLQVAGFGLCVITNQSGVARGFLDESQLSRIHQRLGELLQRFDVRMDGIYHCPHAPKDGCLCRKPLPGLVLQAMSDHRFQPARSWVIGDKEVDIELGRSVGARTILVRTGYGRDHEAGTRADHVVDDLAAAAETVLAAGP